jgi:hypothetical protein
MPRNRPNYFKYFIDNINVLMYQDIFRQVEKVSKTKLMISELL